MSTDSPCPCEAQDPQIVTNVPNLSTIAYRVGEFGGFRRALLQSLPDETALAGWHPAEGDLGLQVLEWWAYLADVLTFYNERIANESYLRTAELAPSVSGLVALLGYKPRPGIAATGQLAALRSRRNLNEPLMIPEGTQFASQATPGVPVQTYEALSSMTFTSPVSNTVVLPAPDPGLPHIDPATGAPSVLLAGRVGGLAEGDALLLVRRDWTGTDQNWAQVTVAGAAPEVDPYGATNTRVTFSSIEWGLQMPAPKPARLVRFDRADEGLRADLGAEEDLSFGVTELVWDPLWTDPPPAAPEADPQVSNYQLLRPRQTAALWSASDTATTGADDNGHYGVRLSAVVRSITPGDAVLFVDASTGGGAVLGFVAGTSEELLTIAYPDAPPPTPPTIPVSHTVLALALPSATDSDSLADLSPTSTAVRHAFREVGTMIPSPATALPPLPTTVTSVQPLPTLLSVAAFIQDATGAGIPVTATTDGTSVSLAAPTGTPESPQLQLPLQLLIDLIPVSQGATVASELLGTGNAALANQTFALQKSPLTYLAQGSGYVSTLQIAVGGTYWTEVASVYGQAPDARIFTVTQQADGTSVVRFGDGVEGARLPTGASIVASYRYGSGAASPPAGRLTTILRPQSNLASIANPWPVAGGADPEPAASLRSAAPASVLSFGRAISADDYETIAAQAPGVSRARAYWTWDADAQRATIKIYVGDGAAAPGFAAAALAGSDDPNRPVLVDAATAIGLSLSCGIVIAPDAVAADVMASAQTAVAALFAPSNMGIGQTLYSSEVAAALLVPGATGLQDLRLIRPVALTGPPRRFLFERLAPDLDPLERSLFSGPISSAEPGEGSYFTLSSPPNLWPVAADG